MSNKTSDTRSKTVAPTTLQSFNKALNSAASNETDLLNSDEYLDKIEEDLNKKVDSDIEILVEGMTELVKMSKIEGKDHYRVAQEAFQAECRTESMIRAAHSLLSLSHSLKLLHLFSDTATPSEVRQVVTNRLEKEIEEAKEVLKGIIGGKTEAALQEDIEMRI